MHTFQRKKQLLRQRQPQKSPQKQPHEQSARSGTWLTAGLAGLPRLLSSGHALLPLVFCLLAFSAGMVWAAPAVSHWQLDNGAKVYLMHTDAMPIVDVQLDFDAGSRRDPAAQAGLAQAVAAMLDKGVDSYRDLPAREEAELANAWSDIGAQFSASVLADRFSFRLRSLSTHALLAQASVLAQQQLAVPAWQSSTWQRERERMVAALAEADTRPAARAAKAYAQAVYQGHSYGQQMTAATLNAISVQDMQTFYRFHMLPCRARVSIVGGLDRQQASELAQVLLSALEPVPADVDADASAGSDTPAPATRCAGAAEVPAVQPLPRASEQYIPFEAAQAHIYLGQPGYRRSDPDHLALYVGNYILGGGGFASRLMEEVREKRGLTYGVGSHFHAGLHAGAFTIALQTRPDQAQQALQVVRQVLSDFVRDGVSDEELQAAKGNLANSMGLRTDSNARLLGYLAYMAWHDLPLTYLDDWRGAINAVSKAQIKKAFARVLNPEAMATVVLGGAVSDISNAKTNANVNTNTNTKK